MTDLDKIIDALNQEEDPRSSILEAENEIAKLFPYFHGEGLIEKACNCKIDVPQIREVFTNSKKVSEASEKIEAIYTKREITTSLVTLFKILKDKNII